MLRRVGSPPKQEMGLNFVAVSPEGCGVIENLTNPQTEQ